MTMLERLGGNEEFYVISKTKHQMGSDPRKQAPQMLVLWKSTFAKTMSSIWQNMQ